MATVQDLSQSTGHLEFFLNEKTAFQHLGGSS